MKYLKLLFLLLCGFWLLGAPFVTAAPLTACDIHSINNGTAYYDPCAESTCPSVTGGETNTGINGGGSWNSGLQPPYILEQFAIETLKDVAQKRGVPENSAVSQEHVIGLLAFMYGEGGDINNDDLFNPLNTGINAPELLAGNNATNGVQSFKSFDAGVEATARTMVGSNQSRLADALIDPNTTADQFMHALAYYQQYPGNHFWAEASAPPNQDAYYQQRLTLVQQVRSNYQDIAALEIGTPAHELIEGIRDISKLRFGGGAGDKNSLSSGSSSCGCSPTDNPAASTGSSVIAIDPGHANSVDPESRNPQTGLYDTDYPNSNTNEMANVWTAAGKIKTLLEAKGYTVFITKNSEDEALSLSQRAQRANDSHAALLFTMHTNRDGSNWLGYPDEQSVRIPGPNNDPSQRIDAKTGLVHPEIIASSKQFAQTLAPLLAQSLNISGYQARSFQNIYGADGLLGNGKNYGNTPVQTILSAVPEVYSEISNEDLAASDQFAQAVSTAIEQVVPLAGDAASQTSASQPNCQGKSASSIVQHALLYSWPDDSHGAEKKPEYQQALAEFNPGLNGIDCGQFVATVMRASGADPNYPVSGTAAQEAYVRTHPELYDVVDSVSSTADLQPGDILIVNKGSGEGHDGHTYIYVGSQPPSGYNEASASLGTRAANLGMAQLSDIRGNYLRARLK